MNKNRFIGRLLVAVVVAAVVGAVTYAAKLNNEPESGTYVTPR